VSVCLFVCLTVLADNHSIVTDEVENRFDCVSVSVSVCPLVWRNHSIVTDELESPLVWRNHSIVTDELESRWTQCNTHGFESTTYMQVDQGILHFPVGFRKSSWEGRELEPCLLGWVPKA
jgi:hypothetical protein